MKKHCALCDREIWEKKYYRTDDGILICLDCFRDIRAEKYDEWIKEKVAKKRVAGGLYGLHEKIKQDLITMKGRKKALEALQTVEADNKETGFKFEDTTIGRPLTTEGGFMDVVCSFCFSVNKQMYYGKEKPKGFYMSCKVCKKRTKYDG